MHSILDKPARDAFQKKHMRALEHAESVGVSKLHTCTHCLRKPSCIVHRQLHVPRLWGGGIDMNSAISEGNTNVVFFFFIP